LCEGEDTRKDVKTMDELDQELDYGEDTIVSACMATVVGEGYQEECIVYPVVEAIRFKQHFMNQDDLKRLLSTTPYCSLVSDNGMIEISTEWRVKEYGYEI
jgi:hypothetical protein